METYGNEDITGLARVFTGFSYGGPGSSDRHFQQQGADPRWDILPMKGYPKFHSTSEKRFLGLSIPAQKQADPEGDLKRALDHLFHHPNVGPFFGRQLIQRLVTSNPSPAYVGRVARAFADNGRGVRGDMRAVIRAVLLDREARDPAPDAAGRLREPVLRFTQWMRAFHAGSDSGEYRIGNTDNPGTALGQTPLRSPSVFNFFRPGFIPPGGGLAAQGLVAPEMQLVSESAVAGYVNYIQRAIESGAGRQRDVQADYRELLPLAATLEQLVAYLDLLLTGERLSPASRERMTTAIAAVPLPVDKPQNADRARLERARLATLLVMVSPEYLVQR
ncbi:MAG: hypothetical protein CGU28_00070 [Candidatus Dactylopiibacterium carminicum]|uniref:DUF1800 domain-containing protein n=1 Tax=Candidatus Dactylopiibacterium carminicum TaxID=857335 RepID=A0ABQ7HLP4_9RHOO|nr:DUF1800 domain-containing protein [Candidatus Dactylopiibacterium carminicum]PAS98592.1 MAG: hypothetical protein CGU28_00070 [Candidatus Dactylopiibacterium carminicum]